MVGAGTVRADDPQLTVRGMGKRRQPVRVVVSSDLNLPPTAQMFTTTKEAPVWLCHGPADAAQFTALGAETVPCSLNDGRIDLKAALGTLADKGLTRIFCEGGGGLAASLLADGLVDRLEVFQAGKVFGADGIAAVAGMGVDALSDAAQFQLVQTRQVGGDVLTSWDRLDRQR
jgi:diaminohydroxyphosphoribosylaminopyrimidine deaminase/5-amino-6-(5-phosphoribosylamino)uracil reductase